LRTSDQLGAQRIISIENHCAHPLEHLRNGRLRAPLFIAQIFNVQCSTPQSIETNSSTTSEVPNWKEIAFLWLWMRSPDYGTFPVP
jgi:hypothetical protein